MCEFLKIWRRARMLLSYGLAVWCGKALMLFVILSAPARAEEVTVLALGDSLTQGFGLIEAEGFVPQLQGWLDAEGAGAQLINGGVSGDTTEGGAARVDWSLTPEVDAMIVTLGGNDLLRGLDPALSRVNLERIIQAALAKEVDVLLVGMEAPGNYGPDYKVAFDSMFGDLAQQYDLLLYENFFAGLGETDPAKVRHLFQPDGIHPNANGVEKIVTALGPSVLELIARAR